MTHWAQLNIIFIIDYGECMGKIVEDLFLRTKKQCGRRLLARDHRNRTHFGNHLKFTRPSDNIR